MLAMLISIFHKQVTTTINNSRFSSHLSAICYSCPSPLYPNLVSQFFYQFQRPNLEERVGSIAIIMKSGQKKIWTEQEDAILQRLYQEEGVQDWSELARRMFLEHGLPRKSAKQCRQRYENHINQDTARMEWTLEEEARLIQLHDHIGNKWALIAQGLPGKSDNTVKNHFYSKLRRVLRRLNAAIHAHFRREFREIGVAVVYKLVEGCEELFKESPACQREVSLACREVQNKLLRLSLLKEDQLDTQEQLTLFRETVKEIYTVSKLYKRKNKKARNSSIQAPAFKPRRNKQPVIVQPAHSLSPQSSPFQDSAQQTPPPSPLPLAMPNPQPKKVCVVVKDEQQGIKDLLKDAGLLQFDRSQANSLNGLRFSSRSSFKSYSEKNDSDQQFFEDSDLERNFSNRHGSCFRFVDNPSERSQGEGPPENFFH